MKTLFNNIDKNVIEYWKKFGLTESDFYCRICHLPLISQNTAKILRCVFNKSVNDMILATEYISNKNNIRYKPFIENPEERWAIKGRTLSGKTYFRKICWNCFFNKLRTEVDIAKKARKSSWYKKILNGENPIPISTTSPSPIFKYLFDITDEELEIEHNKFDTASKNSFIRRYGEKIGLEKFKLYSKRQSYTCSKEYMMNEKGLTEEEWNQFNLNRASTKENFILRYGKEEGIKRWEKYCEYESIAGNKLEWFEQKLGKEYGLQKYIDVCKRKVLSLENFIRKYGKHEGTIRFNELTNKSFSNMSQGLFRKIDKELGDLSVNSHYAIKNGEFSVTIKDQNDNYKLALLDYLLNTKVIEFNGDYWHANPAIYKKDDIILLKTGNSILAQDIWNRDQHRILQIQKLGYQVKVIWEKDFRENYEQTIKDCIEFLKK